MKYSEKEKMIKDNMKNKLTGRYNKSILVASCLLLGMGNVSAATTSFGIGADTSASSANTIQQPVVASTTVSSQQSGASSGASVASDQSVDNTLGDTALSQEAFSNTVKTVMPFTPEQISSLKKMYDDSQKAASSYAGEKPPKPTSSSVIVDLSPGSTPPTIRLRAGYISSLVFLDSSGQPWPITAYDLGDSKSFSIQPSQPDGKSNTIMVQASSAHTAGNLAIMLKGQQTPVMLTLQPGQQAVDYRVDLRVPGLGPNAQATINGMPGTVDPQLVNFLDDAPPEDAKQYTFDNDLSSKVWVYQGKMYLRTRSTLMSPSWMASMSSPDGMNAYELMKSPIIMVSNNGRLNQLKVNGL